MKHDLKKLPPDADLETRPVLRKVASVHRHLAELKVVSTTIPDQPILINTLSLQEAKDSSAIENIITTHDDLFREEVFPEYALSASAKEVGQYVSALKVGFSLVQSTGTLTPNHIVELQAALVKHRSGFRTLPGTELKNEQSGETVYIPPQHPQEIVDLMPNLGQYINDPGPDEVDPLVRMAVIHYQFESIHPFYDGNGRTGRIINVLYLVLAGLLDIPVLYLSRHIVKHKSVYYELLQKVRAENAWEEWILFMLGAVEETSKQAILTIREIRQAIEDYSQQIRARHKFYSQDLINDLFSHPYTKIEFVMRDLKVSRHTAMKYLDALCADGLLTKRKIVRSNYYVNTALCGILTKES
jgi:Fic family protein